MHASFDATKAHVSAIVLNLTSLLGWTEIFHPLIETDQKLNEISKKSNAFAEIAAKPPIEGDSQSISKV